MFQNPTKAARIFLGRYYFDENMAHGFSQAFTRYSWEALQTWVGYNSTQFKNLIGDVDRVDYLGGATFATDERSSNRQGVTLGPYINISIHDEIVGSFSDRVLSDPLFMHEYGHTMDSQLWGIGYLPFIGVPSGLSAWLSTSEHRHFWTEIRANKWAKRYFGKHYGVDWNGSAGMYYRSYKSIEEVYPTK